MLTRQISRFLFLTAVSLVFLFGETSVKSAPVNRNAPTAPANLTVTGVSETTIGLAWGASSGRFGIASYQVRITNHDNPAYNTLTSISGSQTNYTARFLAPDNSYSVTVSAVDSRGNRSTDSNAVFVDTQADTTPPTPPGLTAQAISPSQVVLTWTQSTDNLPLNCCSYLLIKDGVQYTGHINWLSWSSTSISASIRHLTPGTQYTFNVTAADYYNNRSTSNTVNAATEPSSDVTPPSPPSDLHLVRDYGCGEVDIGWTQSFDDIDGQEAIEYEIYVNGVLSPLAVARGVGVDFVYATAQGDNVFVVRAVDRSGNTSAPSKELTLNLWPC